MNETVRILAGELRADIAPLFAEVSALRVLLAAPGLIAIPPESALRNLAIAPSQSLTAPDAHAWLRAYLDSFGRELDALPQTLEWERHLVGFRARLVARAWSVRFHGLSPVFERLICRETESVLSTGPLTRGIADRSPDQTLVPLLRGETHRRARHFFDGLWGGAEDVGAHVERLIAESWAGGTIDPVDLYYKVALEYFEDIVSEPAEDDDNPLLEVMADFQVRAYQTAKGILRRYGGVLLSDVVGLGKTYVGLALVRHLQVRHGQHAVVVGPPAVCAAWRDLAEQHRIELPTVSHGKLADLERYADREVLVVDESHNFRNADTARYETLQRWLRDSEGVSHRRVILISATPQNNRARDVLRQLQLFPDGFSRLPFVGEDLESFFREVENGRASLRDVLQHVVVRRTRRFIRAGYPNARIRQPGADGQMVSVELRFPRRLAGPEQCLRYSIDEAYPGGLYQEIMTTLTLMAYPLYGLAAYIRPEHAGDPRLVGVGRTGTSLRGLVKVLLLKRLESSVHAFRQTLRGLRERLRVARTRLIAGEVVVRQGRAARSTAEDREDETVEGGERVVEASRFFAPRLELDLLRDLDRVTHLLEAVEGINRDDAKVACLRAALARRPPTEHRTVIFTQFADTAEYLASTLGSDFGRAACQTGSSGNPLSVLRRFAPRAQRFDVPPDEQIHLLISTDALSEGVNLQDADTLINYDLHWNPIRLIQRAGRIDRIGSPNEEILIASFLPERALETHLGLEEVLRRRIREFTQVFGEDGEVLPGDDRLDPLEAAEAYDGQALEAADGGEDLDGLAWHAERALKLREAEPERYARVLGLRDGRRSHSSSSDPAVVALRAGWLWSFFRDALNAPAALDHVEALDVMWRHAEAGVAEAHPAPEAIFALIGAATQAFQSEAELLDARRTAPRLSAIEKWVHDELETFRGVCPTHLRPQFDAAVDWVRAAQYGIRVRPLAQRWRREGLAGVALLEELRVLVRRLPTRDERLGVTRVMGCVSGSQRFDPA